MPYAKASSCSDYTNNQATLHTASGCQVASNATAQSLDVSSSILGTNCAAAETGNAGCGMRSNSDTTYGSGFNSIGGGVYAGTYRFITSNLTRINQHAIFSSAVNWDDNGIEIYFFPRGQIPNDLIAEAPQPTTWGTAMASFPSQNCNTGQFFKNHSIIFDTTLWCVSSAGARVYLIAFHVYINS